MNWVDTLVLLVLAISALVAFSRGFVAEVLGIAAWVGAFFAATSLAPIVRPTMRGWVGSADIADPAAYAAVFLVSLIVLSIITGMVGGFVRESMLGGIDRTLGVVFGLARGVVVVAATYAAATFVVPTDRWPDPVAEARATPHIYAAAMWLVRFLPPEYRPHIPLPPEPRTTRATDLLQSAPQGRATARP